jgi:ankyrin repeat protein
MKQSLVTPNSSGAPLQKPDFPKIPLESYSVLTVFGNCLLNSRTKVIVKEGERFTRIPITDLKPEQEVLFAKEGIQDITLSQMNEALLKSERYAATMPVLFRRLSDGSHTTAFRYALLEGMVNLPDRWPGVIAESVRFTLGDPYSLNEAQLDSASMHIFNTIRAADILSAGKSHIHYNWLTGQVIAPLNKEEIFPVLSAMAPGLPELLSAEFEAAYRLYVNIRKTVMHSISLVLRGKVSDKREDRNGNGGQSERNPSAERASFSARAEVKLVADYFASQVSIAYAAARVIEVKKIEPKEGGKRSPRGLLFKGLVTAAPDGFDVEDSGPDQEQAEIADPEKERREALGDKLLMAVRNNQLPVMSDFLGKGADVNRRDADGRTSLMLSIINKNDEMLKLLLLGSADVRVEDYDGDTALIHAVRAEYPLAIDALLRKGANVYHTNHLGQNSLEIAKGNQKIEAMLLLYAKTEKKQGPPAASVSELQAEEEAPESGKTGMRAMETEFLNAVMRDDMQTVMSLLEQGVDPNCRTKGKGKTALMIATVGSRKKLARFLMDSGADPNLQEDDGSTALMFAAWEYKNKVAKVILDYEVDLDKQNKRGETALIRAIRRNNTEMVDMLLGKMADPRIRGFQGNAIEVASSKPRWHHYIPKLKEIAALLDGAGPLKNS